MRPTGPRARTEPRGKAPRVWTGKPGRGSWSQRLRRESAEAAAAGLLLSALVLVLLLPLEAAGPVYYRDLSQNFLPLRMLSAELRERGESDRWNPYLGGGVPL